MKIKHLALALGILVLPLSAVAHSGGTASSGGHYCWTDCEAYGLQVGEYHYHDENDNPVSTYDGNDDIYDIGTAERLHGNILLQVEEHGEAWYVRSSDSKRYYMKDGAVAYEMMRFFSLGITDANLERIASVEDTTEMNDSESICETDTFAAGLRGEILLQVEQHGEAWYVDPSKCLRIYMEDGDAAYEIMRYLGLGITNADLDKIAVGTWETEEEEQVEPIEYLFSGYGSDYTEMFELEEGIVFFTATHANGDSNFITHLLNSDGLTIDYLTNEIGKYEGRVLVYIDEPGDYLLNIDADGNWSFEITQNQSSEVLNVPLEVAGGIEDLRAFAPDEYEYMTDDVIGPIYLESGLHTAYLSQLGSSNCVVWLVDDEGNQKDLLINEIGTTSANEAFNVSESGNYYLTIIGDGAWHIELE